MKFSCSVDIDLPRSKVVELFDNPDNMVHWQDSFVSFTHLSGEKGQVGSKAKVLYKQGKRDMELIETVTVHNLPEEFTGTYEHIHMTNEMQNLFIELSPNQTRWKANVHYTQLNGFVIKAMVFLMPSMFTKQVQKWMDQFKTFAEGK